MRIPSVTFQPAANYYLHSTSLPDIPRLTLICFVPKHLPPLPVADKHDSMLHQAPANAVPASSAREGAEAGARRSSLCRESCCFRAETRTEQCLHFQACFETLLALLDQSNRCSSHSDRGSSLEALCLSSLFHTACGAGQGVTVNLRAQGAGEVSLHPKLKTTGPQDHEAGACDVNPRP